MDFAFYGRVSTEDQQDPESSKAWQVSRSTSLIEPSGGKIVAHYFDVGQSRSLPWKRRPEASRLLADLKDPARGFDAVVIGEPARAFYGNQFGLTFPVFVHYGVQLWVPEVGGAVDPGSEAHDLVMSLYGGMSKGERNRIRIRVRTAMASQAKVEGRFLGGRPPYGYKLVDGGPHPNPGKAANGQRLQRLEPDLVTAPVVQRIFAEYLSGAGIFAIAERLTRDGILSPSGYDPRRNSHRSSSNGAWGKSAVNTILQNPRYTGRQVWNKQRRDEVLLDVEDVSLGHETKQRWNARDEWIISDEVVHPAIIPFETFEEAQSLRHTRARSHDVRIQSKRVRGYALSGVLFCDVCGRRMSGIVTHGLTYYRCNFPKEYALTKEMGHPKSIYVREELFLPELDRWIAQLFSEDDLPDTCARLAHGDTDEEARVVAESKVLREKLADCDAKLEKYRNALEQGMDAGVVSGWIQEVTREQLSAQAILQELRARKPAPEEICVLIGGLVERYGDVASLLAVGDARLKSELYQALGVRLSYNPDDSEVKVEIAPRVAKVRVGGGT